MKTCKQCGLCCVMGASPDTWEAIADGIKEAVRSERMKYISNKVVNGKLEEVDNVEPQIGNIQEIKNRKNKTMCLMLIHENGKNICLVEKLYGKDSKPLACQRYPADRIESYCEGDIHEGRLITDMPRYYEELGRENGNT